MRSRPFFVGLLQKTVESVKSRPLLLAATVLTSSSLVPAYAETGTPAQTSNAAINAKANIRKGKDNNSKKNVISRSKNITFDGSCSTENVVVTGSALHSGKYNPNPVQIITAKQINMTGSTNLGDYLQRLPSIGSSGTTNTQTNGGIEEPLVDTLGL